MQLFASSSAAGRPPGEQAVTRAARRERLCTVVWASMSWTSTTLGRTARRYGKTKTSAEGASLQHSPYLREGRPCASWKTEMLSLPSSSSLFCPPPPPPAPLPPPAGGRHSAVGGAVLESKSSFSVPLKGFTSTYLRAAPTHSTSPHQQWQRGTSGRAMSRHSLKAAPSHRSSDSFFLMAQERMGGLSSVLRQKLMAPRVRRSCAVMSRDGSSLTWMASVVSVRMMPSCSATCICTIGFLAKLLRVSMTSNSTMCDPVSSLRSMSTPSSVATTTVSPHMSMAVIL
mmetsp:Transcript_57443/g.134888  ORF Transcript_57443/g.134888 Transcript_57443/m.134888 type:complete len:285 (+) Transcript_57443:286-1140(+)